MVYLVATNAALKDLTATNKACKLCMLLQFIFVMMYAEAHSFTKFVDASHGFMPEAHARNVVDLAVIQEAYDTRTTWTIKVRLTCSICMDIVDEVSIDICNAD
jgi:hypothetical protein